MDCCLYIHLTQDTKYFNNEQFNYNGYATTQRILKRENTKDNKHLKICSKFLAINGNRTQNYFNINLYSSHSDHKQEYK